MRHILKIGAAIITQNRLLVVRKYGSGVFILPGGKPEFGEDEVTTLAREIDEELRCDLFMHTVRFLGTFSDRAADADAIVTVRLYGAALDGSARPSSEIEQVWWFDPDAHAQSALAPSIRNHILPFLLREGHLATSAPRRRRASA